MDIRGFQCRFLSVITLSGGGDIYDFHYRFSIVVTPPEEGYILDAFNADSHL